MSFRRRTVLLAAGAVAAAVLIASVVVYVVTRNELLGQLDASLRQKPHSAAYAVTGPELEKLRKQGNAPALAQLSTGKAAAGPVAEVKAQLDEGTAVSGSVQVTAQAGRAVRITGPARRTERHGSGSAARETAVPAGEAPPSAGHGVENRIFRSLGGRSAVPALLPFLGTKARLVLPAQALGGATGYVQLSELGGPTVHTGPAGSLLPITATTRAVAAGRHRAYFSDIKVNGTPARMFTEQAGKDAVWQSALPLTDLNSTLSNLQLVLALVCLGGVALAAALGLLVSRAALVPVRRLTGAAERVARTQDLGHRIGAGADDDLGRLAASFNTMLAALERSRLAQRQLVSDASHELRTPLTSVQANLDVLALGDRLGPGERARVVSAVQSQLSELTVLVGDLVDLSKNEVEEVEVEDVRLDLAAASALERARLHAPRCRFTLDAQPCLVRAAPARLDRAIANLLDNACQWSPSPPLEAVIEVCVRDGVIAVRDHGPGIAEEDLPRVFDRFYRSPAARGRPGSGLGLAIVRSLAETHGGAVHADNAPGGGRVLTLELPPLEMTDSELAACAPAEPAAEPLHRAPRIL